MLKLLIVKGYLYMISVKVDGKEKQFNNNVSYYEICKSFGYDNRIQYV